MAINPGQSMFHVAKDSGILAKYGFSADVVLIPGTPRTIQALIAGDLDYVVSRRAGLAARPRPGRRCDDPLDLGQLFQSSGFSCARIPH